MDRRFLTVLGVSLVFALVVSGIFYQMTARSATNGKQTVREMKDIVVAARPLSTGVMVKPADVKLNKIPAETFPKGGFSRVEDVLDRPVISNILLEEPLLDGRLASKGSGLGLAPTIPVGMRAVAVRVNDVGGVAGFVLPGMRVDVLVTGPGPEGTVTRTSLQNIQVLSAGQTIQADARGQAIQAPTVTLLATPEQAETLALANLEGHIQLVLRNSSDQAIENTPGRYVRDLYDSRRLQMQKASAASAASGTAADGTPAPPPKVRRPVASASSAAANAAPNTEQATAATPSKPATPEASTFDQIIVIRGSARSVESVPTTRVDPKTVEAAAQPK